MRLAEGGGGWRVEGERMRKGETDAFLVVASDQLAEERVWWNEHKGQYAHRKVPSSSQAQE